VGGVAFSPDGGVLLAASSDGVRAWGWEPTTLYDFADFGTAEVGDVVVNSVNQAVCCAVNQTFVSVWVVNLNVAPLPLNANITKQLKPFAGAEVAPRAELRRAVDPPPAPPRCEITNSTCLI
jgi:hypothetical protein